MRDDIIKYLGAEVKRRCELPDNFFGMGCFYHIEAVVKNSELLADKYNADKEVVIIAAWLHDIASVTDYNLYKQHHIYGAEMANDILQQLGYDRNKIKLVEQCIKNHRGSISNNRKTVEELCVADADAISHFDNIPSLLYLTYVKRKMGIDEGKMFVRNKLERSFQKLSSESKGYYLDKYEQTIRILV
ncbi:Metal dependent phosphohydrolase [Tepidanaerobacter acetatoxydans Re1]|uniref:Metal dependent phosphohydrolase n=1 Tax=Tepidanaerobacter acetatoxydans (strain DSM 21804 / JCM 16047 / Re1) TaxID=1209989 RepID=F4LXI9_TEPAE|nr:HD domain-containing protein [Tepidanaerobacter acetatoxydans]AEE91091.1 metal dependent phosphohydrolase [Tepidanaerobacter acetatoxydans Re1]CCP25727.1 Metal dependent phosphohydrolase [Tepidanaerobacter acetatoxydans Re1]